ncbi:PDDEXK nuclease domain-containing protein [Runella salmonicolor]|uniref:PDDEXK nuclease domain-containing protein n=1 Tax=Runella salmonicolor TaxID=2950278 RepID=A0ABT1FWW9_9BACT|nr:PDDEXK nuclease domain-containing protein [Runella salmonicolor]MCP1386264.1 PDDEXK nuclease domain-containing protein [Runella salmonicolor]
MDISYSQVQFIAEIKQKVRQAQYEALKAVNTELINLYWELGKAIAEKQAMGWGKAIVPTLSKELQKEFPEMTGFSEGNLWLMAQFYTEYQADINLVPMVREISWSKHIVILKRCKDPQERLFYTIATKKMGWTKDVLIHQVENKTYQKYLLNQTNFNEVLPDKIKNQAYLAVKDQYNFGFLEMSEQHSEYELEQALIRNIRDFLLELGADFSFIGNQYKIHVDDKEYRIDLLLFHRKLQSLIAIELKIGEFEPEYKGKMEFYLSVLNDTVKLPHENPAIGIIICKSKNRTVVEYSLKTATLPIGIATYTTTEQLPETYKDLLPMTEEIMQKLMEWKG